MSQGQTRMIDRGHVNDIIDFCRHSPPSSLGRIVVWESSARKLVIIDGQHWCKAAREMAIAAEHRGDQIRTWHEWAEAIVLRTSTDLDDRETISG